jgi:hypothetical protein
VGVEADGRFSDADFGLCSRNGGSSSLKFWSRLLSYTCGTFRQRRTNKTKRGSPAAQSQHTMQHDLSLAYLSEVFRSSIPNEFRLRRGSVFLLGFPRRSSVCLET